MCGSAKDGDGLRSRLTRFIFVLISEHCLTTVDAFISSFIIIEEQMSKIRHVDGFVTKDDRWRPNG